MSRRDNVTMVKYDVFHCAHVTSRRIARRQICTSYKYCQTGCILTKNKNKIIVSRVRKKRSFNDFPRMPFRRQLMGV